MKQFIFDLSTTGKKFYSHGIFALSGVLLHNGDIVDSINLDLNPITGNKDSTPSALQLHNLALTDLMAKDDYQDGFEALKTMLSKHTNKFSKTNKIIPVGWYTDFTVPFLRKFMNEHCEYGNDNSLWYANVFSKTYIDIASLLVFKFKHRLDDFGDFHLYNVCEVMGLDIDCNPYNLITAEQRLLAISKIYSILTEGEI